MGMRRAAFGNLQTAGTTETYIILEDPPKTAGLLLTRSPCDAVSAAAEPHIAGIVRQ